MPGLYSKESETDIVLRDGSTVHVRPVRCSDAEAIRSFLHGVSREAIGLRFFGAPDLGWVVSWSLDVDYVDRFALVAETGDPRRIIAQLRVESAEPPAPSPSVRA